MGLSMFPILGISFPLRTGETVENLADIHITERLFF